MNKYFIMFILKSILFITVSSDKTVNPFVKIHKCDKECDTNIKILDPAVSLGKLTCTDHGVYEKACNKVRTLKIKCTLTPLINQKSGDCYHMSCQWKNIKNMKIKWLIASPYNEIHVDIYPKLDIHPLVEIFLFLIMFLCLCAVASNDDPFVAGYAGGSISSWGNNRDYGFSNSSSRG